MLNIIPHQMLFLPIEMPDYTMIRTKSEVTIEVIVMPPKYNLHHRNRQRITIMVKYVFIELLDHIPFEVAGAIRDYDIDTDRKLNLIELYSLVKTVEESLKRNYYSCNIPSLRNETFFIDPPDIIKAKLLPYLIKINEDKNLVKSN
jgi:hypothetical protein